MISAVVQARLFLFGFCVSLEHFESLPRTRNVTLGTELVGASACQPPSPIPELAALIVGLPSCPMAAPFSQSRTSGRYQWSWIMGRGILLWLLGIPLPIIILLLLFWH